MALGPDARGRRGWLPWVLAAAIAGIPFPRVGAAAGPEGTATVVAPAGSVPTVPRWHVGPEAADLPPRQRGLTIGEISGLAFDTPAPTAVRRWERPPWVVLSDAPGFDGPALLPLLDATYHRIRREFSFLGDARHPAVLIVFSVPASHERFLVRLAERLGLRYPPIGPAAGMALLGLGMTWVEGNAPAMLPAICVHEATHALTAQLFGVDEVASWLAEGVARRADLLAERRDVTPQVRSLLEQGQVPPLAQLLDARRIPGHGYLPAALLVDWLLADPLRQSQLPQVFRQARATNRTDLMVLFERHMGLTAPELERQWRQWLDERFGPPG